MKVLVVDDTPQNVDLLETLLQGQGYEVSTAVNGMEALERLKQDHAALIISDILMPKMDGFQLCRAVKADDALKNIPFIFYTATYTTEKDRDFALSLGASRFILKPTAPHDFISIIKEVLMEKGMGLLKPGVMAVEKETEYLKEHRARLIKKLGDKIIELEGSEERYRSLVFCAIDAIITLDGSGTITTWNDGAENTFGYESVEVLGQHFSLLFPEDFRVEQNALIMKLKENNWKGHLLEAVGRSKKGDLIPVGISFSLMKDKQGKDLGFSAIIRNMTERNHMEEALRASEAKYRQLYESMVDAYVRVDMSGRIIEFNKAYLDLLGYTEEELTRLTYNDITPERWHAMEAAIVEKQVLTRGYSDVYEKEYRRKVGTLVSIELRTNLIKDGSGRPSGMWGIIRDITERKRAEEALKTSEKFVEDVLATVDEAFVVVDRDYRIQIANKAYCMQTGRSLENIIGRHCYEILHHATRPCHETAHACECKRTFETGEPAVTVRTLTGDNGKPNQVEIKTFAMKDESGGVKSIIEVINDITEKTALENQLHQAQKMEAIGTLAGGIAHDFNNILSAIIGYGHVTLMKMPKDDPQRLNIEHILESADRAATLTQSLLAFSRKQIIDRKPVDLNAILNKVEKFLARVIGEDVAVHLALAEGALTTFADAGQLEQIFMNLAANARDAMPNGGSFSIATSIIELDSGFVAAHGFGRPGRYALVSATDTGAGMNAETRTKIFEPFFTTKEVGKGTGLGLSMVYGIIKQHDGFINVYSEPDKGTTFRIYLPLITAGAVEAQKAIEAEYPKGGRETILLAEDDANLRKLSVLILEQGNYTVITANDGEEAVKKYMENKDRIQLLLFDIIMPKKNGREAYEEIRQVMPDVPVLFASGYSSDMLRDRSLIEKGTDLIYKPVSPQNLLKKVREVLDGAR